DMARILMRRRANDEAFRKLRDRFTFSVKEMKAIETPDVFRAELTDSGLQWRNQPDRFVIAAAHTFNLPLIVTNSSRAPARIEAAFTGTQTESRFPASDLAPGAGGGYFLRVVESKPGAAQGKLVVRAGDRELQAAIAFDVRPLVPLRVQLVDEQ